MAILFPGPSASVSSTTSATLTRLAAANEEVKKEGWDKRDSKRGTVRVEQEHSMSKRSTKTLGGHHMQDAHIVVDGLSKTYRVADKDPGVWGTIRHFFYRQTRDVAAVANVSFEIQRGEIVGFLGANGAGKTTTLKMLAGLICPTAGRVVVGGQTPFNRRRQFLESITLVMGQKQQLIWDLPTLDSLRINAALYEIDDAERDKRIGLVSEMLEIGDKLKTPVRKLSLGERMKAELLAALLHRPEVLFLDEPTLGLDVNAQAKMRQFLRDYNAEFGATVLLTSHYMADITALCERVLVIQAGGLAFDGPLSGLSSRVADRRTVKLVFRDSPEEDAFARLDFAVGLDGKTGTFDVPRARLDSFLPEILRAHAVDDITVEDPPIEDVLGAFFRNHEQSAVDTAGAP